jgi:hypothetical protein
MKKRIATLAIAATMAFGLALPAAAGGSVNCGGLGYGYTTAGSGSVGARTHTLGTSSGQTVGQGTVPHGAQSGWKTWDITGVGAESAICPQ